MGQRSHCFAHLLWPYGRASRERMQLAKLSMNICQGKPGIRMSFKSEQEKVPPAKYPRPENNKDRSYLLENDRLAPHFCERLDHPVEDVPITAPHKFIPFFSIAIVVFLRTGHFCSSDEAAPSEWSRHSQGEGLYPSPPR